MDEKDLILFETDAFLLSVAPDATVRSLVLKSCGEECLSSEERMSLCSVTQDRPFNNEVKLAYPNKRMTFAANSLRRDGNLLSIGFEIAAYRAIVEVKEASSYLAFRLVGFDVPPEPYGDLCMTPPPVAELRLFQLPVKNREKFGMWLNVMHDDTAAVNVIAPMPFVRVDADRRERYTVMYADALREVKMLGTEAALIVSEPEKLMAAIDSLEADYSLPRGVKSRESGIINHSIYFTTDITPLNVDEHIRRAKEGGFRLMQIYYTACCTDDGYRYLGDYDWRPEYPNGKADLTAMLDKIKAAGILPGLHVLQTHIGVKSRYVTPVADHRLRLIRHFTLAKPFSADDSEMFVEENPEGSETHEKRRILRFGGEIFSYESFTTEPPYRFCGVKHGVFDTRVIDSYPAGFIGGLLDVSEYGGRSVYIEQNSSLQDEIADKIAEIYNCGFRFFYFDGSEGAQAPYEIHVPNAQYRVLKKVREEPLFCEGAAKAHFGWHFMGGGNAFDVFPPKTFKEKLVEHPFEEAPRMRQDFNGLNFGWWGFWVPNDTQHWFTQEVIGNGTQADMYEYGTSLAAAWDCPISLQSDLEKFRMHPRTGDILEVMRRWEDVRSTGWLTDEARSELKNVKQEHTLLINESGEYELVPYDRIPCGKKDISAFRFTRKGRRYVVYWHETGEDTLHLPVSPDSFRLTKAFGDAPMKVEETDGVSLLPAADKLYLETELSAEAITEAFGKAF